MRWKENLALKVLAFFLAAAALTGAAMMGWYQIANFNVIWGEDTPADGYTISRLEWQDYNELIRLLDLYNREAQGFAPDSYDTQTKAALEQKFSTDSTNLRWQARDSEGTVRYGNTWEDVPAPAEGLFLGGFAVWEAEPDIFSAEVLVDDWWAWVDGAVDAADVDNVVYCEDWMGELAETVGSYLMGRPLSETELDTVYLSPNATTELLIVNDDQGTHVYGPTVRSYVTANEYGYQYQGGWYQTEEPGPLSEELDVTLWLACGYPASDKYQQAYGILRDWQYNRGLLLAVNIACAVAGLLLSVYLCVGAGHKRGAEGISLHGFHRIPGDLLLAVFGLGAVVAVCASVELLSWSFASVPVYVVMIAAGALIVCAAVLILALLVTFAARCKARTLWRNTLICRLCRLAYRLCRGAAAAMPLVWKTALAGAAYLLLSALLLGTRQFFLWFALTMALLVPLCLWAWQWKRIRRGAREIIGGHPDYHIDTRRMLPDLKAHADELNNLGKAISAAVEERLKSERFKAELITNVSHDLKTPLTSIINYVDLLKKEDISNPAAREYIDVLDRKSQRLKKLTEDLVEASKASTGALTVNRERLDVVQLVEQAAGEYHERLSGAGLTLITSLPEAPVWVNADGRHLWRVLDNLLGNCAKYALEGTRVYLDVAAQEDGAVISVKNISRLPLNIPAEQLVERFVRGDESRTTEGSGLGLSIARSLTELQGGGFSLAIDGDLFKAVIVFPLAQK